MKAKTAVLQLAAAGFMLTATSGLAQAHQFTAISTVNRVEAGWSADSMAVYLTDPTVVNPGGCAVTDAGFTTLNTDPGRALFHTLILSAMLNGKSVKLLISSTSCAFNKPRIIAVDLFP